jgi:hypothetical protein
MEQAKLRWVSVIPPMVGELVCQFNPAELTIKKSNVWKGDTNPNFNSPFLKFGGGESASYSLSLFFDSYSNEPPTDVRVYTNELFALTMRGAGYSMFMLPYAFPPVVQFVWGKITMFAAVVESVQVSFTMFAEDGTPIRAKADVSFLQNDLTDDIIPAQNPTSRTDPRKTRIAHARQRLDQIAYEEYGDSRFWRVLAEANGMDDPFQLVDGQILIIPQNDLS